MSTPLPPPTRSLLFLLSGQATTSSSETSTYQSSTISLPISPPPSNPLPYLIPILKIIIRKVKKKKITPNKRKTHQEETLCTIRLATPRPVPPPPPPPTPLARPRCTLLLTHIFFLMFLRSEQSSKPWFVYLPPVFHARTLRTERRTNSRLPHVRGFICTTAAAAEIERNLSVDPPPPPPPLLPFPPPFPSLACLTLFIAIDNLLPWQHPCLRSIPLGEAIVVRVLFNCFLLLVWFGLGFSGAFRHSSRFNLFCCVSDTRG